MYTMAIMYPIIIRILKIMKMAIMIKQKIINSKCFSLEFFLNFGIYNIFMPPEIAEE